MRLLKKIFPLLIAGLIQTGYINAQTMYDTYTGFTVPTNPVLPAVETHPSLWFKQNEIAALKNKKDNDAYALKIWNTIQSDITKYSSKTPASKDINERPRMAKILAFGWQMNGDTAIRNKAIETLMLAYDNVPRTETSGDFSGDYDEIYRATWLQNYCDAYDWLFNNLTPAQNSAIRSKLIRETQILRNNMIAGVKYATRPHNHKSKPAWGIITAALTLSSESNAADWLQFGLTMANTVTKYQFSSDGIYREGSHYFIYSLVNFLPYLWNYKNVSGVDHFKYFKPCFEMPLLQRNSKGWIPNIEDSYVKPVPTHMAAKAFVNTPTKLHSKEPLAKILQWNWFNTNFFTVDYTGATNDVVWNINEYITYDPSILQAAPDINTNIKTECGAVIFRDNDTYSKPTTKYLYFNGVAECDNHQHPDMLAYTIESNGSITAVDPGYGKNGYDDTKRSWYISPLAHNTVTVNSNPPLDLDVNIAPKDVQFINAPSFVFSEKEAKISATNGKIKRGIAFPNKKFWVVYDIPSSTSKNDYTLAVHARGPMIRDVNKITWITLNDIYGTSQKLFVFVLGSASMSITDKTGYTSLFKDEIAQSYIEAVQNSDTALFMHLLFPGTAESVFPQVTDKSISGVTAFQVDEIEKDFFALQKKNSLVTLNDITTDAIFTWTNTGTLLNKYFINRGKSFSLKGIELLNSENYVTIAVDYTEQQNEKIYIDTLAAKTRIKIKTRNNPDSINEVLYNGSKIDFGKSGEYIIINIDGAGLIEFRNITSVPGKDNMTPGKFGIKGNYPNPFNPATRINFSSFANNPINLTVYDALGRCRRRLVNNENMKGNFEVTWDGKDEKGEAVPSGVYLFALSDGINVNIKKGILIK